MIRVLVVKTSSMGDIAHTFPAICELKKNIKNIEIDWVVEQSFADIVKLNTLINEIILVDTRKWRKNWFKNLGNLFNFIKKLRSKKYDYIIDAQGLFKSLVITKLSMTTGKNNYGFDKNSIRGKSLSWLYNHQVFVSKDQHAIYRIQELFGKIFSYQVEKRSIPDFGVSITDDFENKTVMFIPNTSWDSKKWPESNWISLGSLLLQDGYNIIINSGNDNEYKEAVYIKENLKSKKVTVLNEKNLKEKIDIIKSCYSIITVDTGLAHVSAALGKKTISIYGATSNHLTGVKGPQAINNQSKVNCSPCLNRKCLLKDTSNFKICYKSISAIFVHNQLKNIQACNEGNYMPKIELES